MNRGVTECMNRFKDAEQSECGCDEVFMLNEEAIGRTLA
jgi:hypothetical protein